MSSLFVIFVLFFLSFSSAAHEHHNTEKEQVEQNISPGMLKARKHFKSLEEKALAQDFKGLQTGEGNIEGLYKIKKTGIDSHHLVSAAKRFLVSLSAEERAKVQFDINSDEWRKWSNVDNGIYLRSGLSLKAMPIENKQKLMSLLNASLSIKGMDKVLAIMRSEHTLKELNDYSAHLDEDLYFITMFGEPSDSEPWGWQYEGHHLALNFFVLGDQVVLSPVFMGAEPTVATTGKYKGNKVLQEEQTLGLALMQSLTPLQQKQATIGKKRPTNMLAAANKDNLVLDYEGIQVSTFTKKQKSLLISLIEEYVFNLNKEHASFKLEEVITYLDKSYFAWVGDTKQKSVFYYRIHSPVILIEFDHQAPVGLPKTKGPRKAVRQHIHTMVRTPNGNDYGKDLLGQHLKNHH